MQRADYLSQPEVTGFVYWAGHLVRGEWGLQHGWKGKGPAFRCNTLYEAFQRYRWPNSVHGEDAFETIARFACFRQAFANMGTIESADQRDSFVAKAREIAVWGGIKNLRRLNQWKRMEPEQLERHIADVKRKFDPATADTEALDGFRYMGSAFSKIYAALVPGLPIYDSRVACALLCLVRLYRRDAGIATDVLPCLELGIPDWRAPLAQRCRSPRIYASQEAKYAKANLQFAWLMQELVESPGDFVQVPAGQRVDALESALFMLGYTRLADDAVIKSR